MGRSVNSIRPQTALARAAADMVPNYARVLGIGQDSGAIEPCLSLGCTFSLAGALPAQTDADLLVLLDEQTPEISDLVQAARRLGKPIVCARPEAEAAETLAEAMRAAGFRLQCSQPVAPAARLSKWVPAPPASADTEGPGQRVLVMSYCNMANFGDRLGYHMLNGVLPADAIVTYGTIHPWHVPDQDYDLLILGIGNSLIASDACLPELADLLDRAPKAIGIFGTQYREQFAHPTAAAALDRILGKLTTWWARYEDDLLAFGRGRGNVRHLGDWLISAFPMATPTSDKGLTIPPDIIRQENPLDRMIQQIQSYRAVSSARLHTLLCALTSADHVAYQEQKIDDGGDLVSGKFRSLLLDIFGRTFPEDELFAVDRAAVVRYKRRVDANIADLRDELHALLGSAPIDR